MFQQWPATCFTPSLGENCRTSTGLFHRFQTRRMDVCNPENRDEKLFRGYIGSKGCSKYRSPRWRIWQLTMSTTIQHEEHSKSINWPGNLQRPESEDIWMLRWSRMPRGTWKCILRWHRCWWPKAYVLLACEPSCAQGSLCRAYAHMVKVIRS